MTLFYPEKPTVVITYENHVECDKDKQILEEAKKEFSKKIELSAQIE